MKTTLAALALWAIIGCTSYRELQQIDMVQVQVVRIDTIWRYTENIKQLTWKDSRDIQYVSYISLGNESYPIGSSMYMMKKR